MEMRKGNDGQGTARSASKLAAKKQPGEQASSGNQGTSMNQEANQGTAAGQGTSMNQGTGQGASMSQGAKQGMTGGQGTSGQQGGEQDLLQHAKQAGGEIVNQVQQRAGSQINRQKEAAATELSKVANAVRRIRENLGGEESGTIARYAADYGEKAANSLERLGNYIREQDPKQLLDDVQNFGRRRPALLLGGAFLLGFAGARLIKSSMEAGYQQQSLSTNVRTPNYTGTNVPTARPSTTPNAV